MNNEQHSNRLNFPGNSNKPGDPNRSGHAGGGMQNQEPPIPASDESRREEREDRLNDEQNTERLRTERQSTMDNTDESGS
jgi:hypothetical protein